MFQQQSSPIFSLRLLGVLMDLQRSSTAESSSMMSNLLSKVGPKRSLPMELERLLIGSSILNCTCGITDVAAILDSCFPQHRFELILRLKGNYLWPGKYELLLNLPDGYKSLQSNPLYSIRLANEKIWEEKTGYNKLEQFVEVK